MEAVRFRHKIGLGSAPARNKERHHAMRDASAIIPRADRAAAGAQKRNIIDSGLVRWLLSE
jgi:hypothetical protein